MFHTEGVNASGSVHHIETNVLPARDNVLAKYTAGH